MRLLVVLILTAALAGCSQQAPTTEEPPHPLRNSEFHWRPGFPIVGQEVHFTPAIRTSAPGDSLRGVLWAIEGTHYNDQQPVHRFTTAGTHTVSLRIMTEKAGQFDVSREVEVQSRTGQDAPTPTQPEDAPAPSIMTFQSGHVVDFTYAWAREADQVFWDFGDGATSAEAAPAHAYSATGTFSVGLRLADGLEIAEASVDVTILEIPFKPHVVVGVADSGFNVYHEVYRRPHLTDHPCTYVRGYPCDVPALELTFDAPTWQAAFEADREKWDAIKQGDRFWIPGTNIIAAFCVVPYSWTVIPEAEDPAVGKDYCILDDTSMHGTGTTSSVLSENPDALLMVAEGKTTAREVFATGEFPVDIISHSWGSAVPTPLPCSGRYSCTPQLFEVTASGNEGAFPVVLDRTKSYPNYMNIGAADAGGRTEPGYSGWKTMDYVSEYCRPTAQTRSFDGTREQYCGTSFSAPTFAGALSRILLELRMQSGHTGGIENGLVDPILGISMAQVRDAINHTATYEPEDQWGDPDGGVPLVAPWYQWGWGYFDKTRVDDAMACLLEGACPARPIETVTYMETLWTYRQATHP